MPQPKAINIQKPVYAMATTDGRSAEITMYGDIYESQPRDWWGDPIEGQFITLSEFMEDLKAIEGCTDITIRMNSYGGDAGVSRRRQDVPALRNALAIFRLSVSS